jgi:ribosomal protein S12 methylthiotransferase
VRATFIVGFPGESEQDFEVLLEFVDAVAPDHTAVFPFWPEEGTKAASLPGQLSAAEIRARQADLMEVALRASQERGELFVGQEVEVLVEGGRAGGRYVGRSFRDAPEVDGQFHLRAKCALALGQWVKARVTKAEGSDLHGEAAGP